MLANHQQDLTLQEFEHTAPVDVLTRQQRTQLLRNAQLTAGEAHIIRSELERVRYLASDEPLCLLALGVLCSRGRARVSRVPLVLSHWRSSLLCLSA